MFAPQVLLISSTNSFNISSQQYSMYSTFIESNCSLSFDKSQTGNKIKRIFSHGEISSDLESFER
jgi:hypothetical protein